MISIEILHSPDNELKGQHLYYFDKIVLGTGYSCELLINDIKLRKKHLQLELSDTELYLDTFSNDTYYLSNNKKISGRKRHQIGDVITIQNTSFKILSFMIIT